MDEGCKPKKTFVGEDDFSKLQKKKKIPENEKWIK